MTKEERELWEKALAIIDDNLGVQEDFIITNRFATASKIVEFAQEQVKKLTIPVVSKSVICPNCEEDCQPISLGHFCNKCYYDKL